MAQANATKLAKDEAKRESHMEFEFVWMFSIKIVVEIICFYYLNW